ncbi:hypothetical protein DPMN_048301 [Dreissena polymorpha]|uniref:Uncharacterized protein n=1 Tax=Dreissena polymorpha TaxID=45954 RepID=A0A9D4DC37_DREPO|nr:hypothetical protein DPMN_048301 [Dreissena polymorpha]
MTGPVTVPVRASVTGPVTFTGRSSPVRSPVNSQKKASILIIGLLFFQLVIDE